MSSAVPKFERVIALSGPLAAGKTTVAEILAEHGYSEVHTRTLIQELAAVDTNATRRQLQDLGLRLRQEHGQTWLYEQALASRLVMTERIVIDAIRFKEDPAILDELCGAAFRHMHVTAGRSIRRERYVRRGGTVEEFDQADVHSVEADAGYLSSVAHTSLVNEEGVIELRHVVENLEI